MNLKDKFRKASNSIGLGLVADSEPYSYNHNDYRNRSQTSAQAHKDFLKTLEAAEDSRLTIIEGKTSQIISQTGVIFSLLSLFVPLLIDKLGDVNPFIKGVLIFLLIGSFFFYLLTINNALKNFNVKSFNYSRPSPINVLSLQKRSLGDFYAEEVRDLLYSLNKNLQANNRKASNLVHSYNSFRIANFLTGILVVSFCITIGFSKEKKEPVYIEKPIKIQHLDSLFNVLNTERSNRTDTVFLKSREQAIKSKHSNRVSTKKKKQGV